MLVMKHIEQHYLLVLRPPRRGVGVQAEALERVEEKCPAHRDLHPAPVHPVIHLDRAALGW